MEGGREARNEDGTAEKEKVAYRLFYGRVGNKGLSFLFLL